MTGTIARLVAEKGFGFIKSAGTSDLFFHRDDYIGNWQDLVEEFNYGEKIEVGFKDIRTAKGPRAQNVSKIEIGNRESLSEA